MPYHVYVIALKPSFIATTKARKANPGYIPGKNCYYVGYTSKSPPRRYMQHLAGGQSKKGHNIFSKVVFEYGIYPNGLRPELYAHLNPIRSKAKALIAEKFLANQLRSAGHCVWQN